MERDKVSPSMEQIMILLMELVSETTSMLAIWLRHIFSL